MMPMSFPTSAVPQPGNKASADTMDNIPIQLGMQDLEFSVSIIYFLSYPNLKKKIILRIEAHYGTRFNLCKHRIYFPGDPLTEAVFL